MAGVFSSSGSSSNNKRPKKTPDISCIFVHAGAGYHSLQNEHIHLQACTDACKAGMAIMRNGGSAADAVEIAIKILEDREITNAAYGSNLAMDGIVECDAVMVDQHGRSGACGAVAQIKNPICLARLILDHSTTQLSLRRVPPNLLVGRGATDFAASFGMPVVPHDSLVSRAARERWLKWKQDLKDVEDRARRTSNASQIYPDPSIHGKVDFQTADRMTEQMRQAHTQALEAGVWNEAQPLSPPPSSDRLSQNSSSPMNASSRSTPSVRGLSTTNTTPESFLDPSLRADPFGPPGYPTSGSLFTNASSNFAIQTSRQNSQNLNDGHFSAALSSSELGMHQLGAEPPMSEQYGPNNSPWNDGFSEDSRSTSSDSTLQLPSLTPSPEPEQPRRQNQTSELSPPTEAIDIKLPDTPAEKKIEHPSPVTATPLAQLHDKQNPPLPPSPQPAKPRHAHSGAHAPDKTSQTEDHVTDTVGAIAIDSFGNIACGASSGGIGMKHRGRIGPAALVGVGAAVVPLDPDDKTKTCVASVTSGTGEHMATTMAATVATERIYHGVKKVKGGALVPADDDEALRSVVEKDFMGHASVKNSRSAGAIGILCVKKTKDGAYLYFTHNTDSFALASMHAQEQKPICTMSRSQGNGMIAQGGRAVRIHRSSVSSRRERHG